MVFSFVSERNPCKKLLWVYFTVTSDYFRAVDGYKRINKFSAVISYFAMREWNFKNDNTQALWKRMSQIDRELFDFDISTLDWDAYCFTFIRGGRVYLLKDPLETIPEGIAKRRKFRVAHYTVIFLFWLLVFVLLRFLLKFVF